MQTSQQNNKRIAKNTLLLYVRMLITMFIGVFTSRIVLQALGVVDYGIYNVVGGVASMFAFINGSMSVSSSRFVAFAIGKGDIEYERSVFKHSVLIHYLFGGVIFLLIETVGLWFLYNKLVIPSDRFDSAFWCLQFSAVFCFVNVISTPYNAMIIGHEKMSVFAYTSILDSLLRLGLCYITLFSSYDKLILYSLLLVSEGILMRLICYRYCKMKFETTRGKFVLNKKLCKEMVGFGGWNVLGNLALMTLNEGVSILLNMFFGPVINAARGVATQVDNLINSFSNNIRTAINPQITKAYSRNDLAYMHELIYISSVYAYYLILACFIPIFLIGDFLLHLWLVNVPAYTLLFLRLSLLYTLVNSFANPIIIGIHATGKIKVFQIVEGILMLTTLPLSYLVLKTQAPPESVYCIMIVVAIVTQVGRIGIVLPSIKMTLKFYIRNIIFPCLRTSALCASILGISLEIYEKSPVLVFVFCMTLSMLSILFVGIPQQHRVKLLNLLKQKIQK